MDARAGSSLSDRAFIAVNPPMAKGVMTASAPPHSAASAYPWRMRRNASPTAFAPPAQAVTTAEECPLKPVSMEIRPAAMFVITIGMKKGETRSNPFSMPRACSLSIVSNPPMPEDTTTAQRALSVFSAVMPLWAWACIAAATAKTQNLSILRSSPGGKTPAPSKSASAAHLTLRPSVSNRVMCLTPHTPFFIALQKVSVSFPVGAMTPRPVMTTLFTICPLFLCYLSQVFSAFNGACSGKRLTSPCRRRRTAPAR